MVCCLECILNMLVSAVYLLTHPKVNQKKEEDLQESEINSLLETMTFGWRFGWVPCYINSYIMEFTPFIYTILLLTLLIDRAFALKDPIIYKKNISVAKQRCYLLLYWLLSIVCIIPIGIGLIKSWPFPDRYSCQVSIIDFVNLNFRILFSTKTFTDRIILIFSLDNA